MSQDLRESLSCLFWPKRIPRRNKSQVRGLNRHASPRCLFLKKKNMTICQITTRHCFWSIIGKKEITRVMLDNRSNCEYLSKVHSPYNRAYSGHVKHNSLILQKFNQSVPPLEKSVDQNPFRRDRGFWRILGIDVTPSNALSSRPWIYKNAAVSSTYHQFLKYPLQEGQGTKQADNDTFTVARTYYAYIGFFRQTKTNQGKNHQLLGKLHQEKPFCTTTANRWPFGMH